MAGETIATADEIIGTAEHKVDLGQIAGAVGAFSAIALFVAANSAYSFARGLSASLGFPAQIMTLKTSTEIFPGIVSQNTIVFMVSLAAGFLIFRRRQDEDKKRTRIAFKWLAALLVLMLVGDMWDEHWALFQSAMVLANFVGPLLVGYAFNAFTVSHRTNWILAGVMAFAVFGINDSALYSQGFSKGKEISTNSKPKMSFAEHGLANVKMADFPLISLKTKDPLQSSVNVSASPDGFLYSSNEKCFLRLIAYDDANYYVIENNSGKLLSLAIRKEVVREMIFLKNL
jgi:hypothetical protein